MNALRRFAIDGLLDVRQTAYLQDGYHHGVADRLPKARAQQVSVVPDPPATSGRKGRVDTPFGQPTPNNPPVTFGDQNIPHVPPTRVTLSNTASRAPAHTELRSRADVASPNRYRRM